MIKKNGKSYVVVEFSSDFLAMGFEQALEALGGVMIDAAGTSLPARQNDDAFAAEDEVNVVNNQTGDVTGSSIQCANITGGVNISGRRVR